MPETSSRVALVRCPKCGHLLPELPPYSVTSVYSCGGCGAYLQADKGYSSGDGMSEKSSEERNREASLREVNGEIESGRANGRLATASRVCKSPVRSVYRDTISNPPSRESNSVDYAAGKPPPRGSVLSDLDRRSKSSGGSMDGDVRKSPARSVRVRKSPLRGGELGDFDEQRSTEICSVTASEELEAREKVGAWFDHVKEEVVGADRLVTQKGSFNDWLQYERTQSEPNESRVSPRRRTSSANDPSTCLNLRRELADRRADQIVGRREFDYHDLYGRGRVEVPDDDWPLRDQDEYYEHLGDRRNEFATVHGDNRAANLQERSAAYPDQGPLNYHSYYGYDHPRHSHESFGGSSSHHDRDERQSMFNDLKEQLRLSGDLPENPTMSHRRVASVDHYGGGDDYEYYEPLRSRRPAALSDRGEHTRMRPHYTYTNRSRVPGAFVNDIYMEDINGFRPSRFMPNEFPLEDDLSWAQIQGREPHHRPHYYPQRSGHDYIPQHATDYTHDSSGLSYQREDLYHPREIRIRVQASPPAFLYRKYRDIQTDPASDYPDPYVQHDSGPRVPHPTPHNPSSHSISSNDSKPDGFDSSHDRAKRAVLKNQNTLFCYPIAGGAPFVSCCNCSQLLRLPKKLIAMKRTQFRLRCGSCVTILSFDLGKKRSHDRIKLQLTTNSISVDDVRANMSESVRNETHESSPAGITNRESYDFDRTGYTFPSTDSEPSMQLDRKLNSIEAEKLRGIPPSSSASENYLDVDHAPSKTDGSIPSMNIRLRPPPGSPLHEHMDYSDIFADKKSDVKETTASSRGKVISDGESSTIGNVQLELPSVEGPNMSQGSAETSKTNDRPGHRKGKSSFGSIGKWGSQDSNTSTGKIDVVVNGQPISHRAVRKAEKMAGPISPGNYWYDSRAGFWGIMGGCCLGIIPPFIQEFGYPMAVHCSGGHTGIYVNGRELHERDLELLSSRKLPRTRNKWYVVDISGKVLDEETGDPVANLGKLAPTVEKARRGFGMQPPEMQDD